MARLVANHVSMTPIVHVGPEVALESSELVNGDEVFLIGFQAMPEHFSAEHAPLRPGSVLNWGMAPLMWIAPCR